MWSERVTEKGQVYELCKLQELQAGRSPHQLWKLGLKINKVHGYVVGE